MAKYSNTVEYNILTKLDSSGLTKLKTELQQVELKLQKLGNQKLLNPEDFSDARTQIRGLSDALSKAFNPTLGITDLSKLNKELQESGVTAEGLRSAFSQLGTDGQIAFNNVIGELGKLDTGILRTNSQVDKLFTTFSNTFRWGLVSSFFSNFMNSIHQSVNYVKELDDSLTQIMLVTDYNRDAMNQYARSANEAAKAVSMTTTGMTNASLVFAQQGYDLNQSQELATLSAKLANASQQDTATTSDQITAYMNAYGLQNSMEELSQQMDNWALIANVSAADVSELAQASQRAASMANTVGVTSEQLAAQIATIESVTRETPEQIGNGLKTLYARFSDISKGGEDEEGVSLGDVTSQLNAIGVQILDQFGNIRNVGDIMEDLMVVWDDLDQTSKIAAAQALAGKYQVNRFVSLMDNSDMYREYKGATGSAATGTLDVMSEEYADSIAGRSAKLQASLEGLFSTIFNTDDIYPWMDAAQGAIDLLQQFFDALGGGKTVLLGISSLLMQIFSKNIAQEINNTATNAAVQHQRQINLENKQAALFNMGMANPELDNGMSNYIIDFAKQVNNMDLNKEQAEQANQIIVELVQNANAASQASDELTSKISGIGTALISTLGKDSKILAPLLEDGIINDTLLRDFLDNASDKQLQELFEGSRQAISKAKDELKNFSQALQQFQQETEEGNQTSDELKNSIERLQDAFSYIKDILDPSTYRQYDEELRNIIETLESSDDASDDISVLTNRIAKLYEELDKLKAINVQKIQQSSSDLEQSNFRQINTQEAFEGTRQIGNAFLDSANKTIDIKNIIDATNAIQQLTFAWQSFQNLGSIWKNNELSDGQKFLQTFMSLTSAILMMSPAIDTLSKKFGILNLQEAANVLTSAKLTIAQSAETIAFGASSVAAGQLTVQQWLLVASSEAATIATTALKTALKLLASPAGIAAIMGIATAIGFIQAQAEEAKQQAQEAFDKAKSNFEQIQSLQDKASAFGDKYNIFKESGENGKELIEEAKEIAQALKDAGAEEEASAVHLAILSAEARGTAKSFDILAQEIEKAQSEAEKTANQDIVESSNKVLENQNTSVKDVLLHQKMIKDAQEELNNLDPLDAGYEEERQRLEHLIDSLKNAKLAQEDLVNAANAYQEAQGRLAGMTVAENQGLNLYAGGQQGKRMTPDSATWFENANLDYNSIERVYSNMVEGFSDLSNLEKAEFILKTIGDEAGEAAAQLELLMLGFDNLSTNQIDHLQNQMAQGGLTFGQQQLLAASLDPDATAAEFSQTIQDVLKEMDENDTTFEVALKAKLKDPEQFQEAIRQQVESYEPKDSEIEQEDYNSMADHFYENKDKMGEEGSGFENYSKDLFDNAEALSEVIEDTLRYSDAIEEISDNFDDWLDILNTGEKESKKYVDAVNGLKDTFSDFLGIPEELSEGFVTTQENLDDLRAAAEGDVDAFDRLRTAAAIDLAEQLGVDSDTAVAAVNQIQSALDTLGYSDIDIGESITFSDAALADINSALDALELDADQAAQFIESAFGFKVTPDQFDYVENKMAEVEQEADQTGKQTAENMTVTPEITTASAEQVATDEKNYTDVEPQISEKPWTATVPVTGGGLGSITTANLPTPVPITGSVPRITYRATPNTATETKKDTALATGVKAEQGGSGVPKNSHVNLKPNATGTRTGGRAPSSSAPRPSSGGGGGGGGRKGGGGGSGKTPKTPKAYEPKTKEPIKKEIDLYEKVNTQLDDVETTLKGIEKEEDRLIGDKARANMDKQISLLSKEIDLQKEKLKIQQQEQSDLAKELTGYGYKFDSDGFITNYNEIIKSYETRLNNLIDQYNKTTTEEGQEALDKQIKQLEEEYDKAKKAADRYDQLQGKELQDTLNAIEELKDAIEDLRIEAWKASTEAIDNIKELRESAADLEGLFSKYESDSPFRDLIVEGEKLNNIWSVGKDQAKDYYNEIIADKQKALKVATDEAEKAAIERSIKYFESLRDTLSDQRLNNGLLGLAYQDMLQLKEWYENPKAEDNLFGDNTAALRDAYEEAYNKVHDMLLEYEKTIEDYRDAIIDGYDEIDEKQNRQIDKFDRIVDKLETFSDMYTLYYGDESYAALRDILQQQGDTLREQLNAQKEIYSYWSEAYAQAIKTGDEKLIQELEDKMHDAEDRMTELAKDAAEAFAESYENAVKASTQYIIQNTIGDRNFDRLDRNWEWDKDYLDKYRDDVEKAYEMDKLRNKYTDLLNQAQGASLQTQNKIRAQMQEQLDLLDGQATVSEYDVKLANAKLEILQKQIALEDAQRNKNQMKLRRDTQGNYRYVYTANQEDVAGAEQDLLDSEYDAYELSKNQQISNYDNLINAYQKYLSQREEILNNANLSEAEKLQQNAELYDKFLKFVNAAKEDFSDAAFGTLDILNWLTLNGTDYTTTAAKDMLNELLDEQGNIKDQTGVIWMDNANYLTDEVIPKIKGAVNEADQDIKNRMEELKENIVGDDGVFPSIREGGKNLEEGLSGLTGFLDSAKTSTDGLAVATRDLMEALGGDNSALAEAQAQLQKYEEELSNVKNASSITAQQLRDAQKALDKSQAENLNYKTQLDDIASGKRDTKGNLVNKKNTKKTGAAPSKSSKKNGELTGFTGVYHYTSWGDNPAGDWYAGIPNAVRISTFSREPWDGPYNVHLETKEGGHLGWVKEEQLFDTGGYTGNWANGDKRENGKLAFLHQKELVLNAEDTQNILAAVDIVRQIGVGLRNSMMNVSSMNGKNLSSVGETIEQRVEITASFPNATDADDIRQALIGLADKAYQYSHRNR